MKIATFNVNSIRVRLAIVTAWLEQHQPDVLAVQETKVQDPDFPAAAFDEIGYKYAFKGQKSYNGVALFSRSEISDIRTGFEEEPKDQARLISGRVGGLTVVNTYIPQGYLAESQKFDYKLNWFERLRLYFQENFDPADSLVWVGDLNVAPSPIDVYDPVALAGHVCYHPEVHKALARIMEWGFTDVFRMHCKEPGQYTFWDYRAKNPLKTNRGWRLDHIMATRPLAQKSTACCIDTNPRLLERPSDHTPVVAQFDL